MKYLHDVEAGQTWRSKDKRDHGRTIKIPAAGLAGDRSLVQSGPRRYGISEATLRARYELVMGSRS